jgi:ankyrin repeat protein
VKGETALTFAAAYGRADVVRVLTANKADVSETTRVQDLAAFAKEEQERLAELFAQQGQGRAGRAGEPGAAGRGRGPQGPQIAGVTRQYNYTELVGFWGGMSPLHMAARQGHSDVANALLEAGADINQRAAGDKTTPLIVAIVNGHFDLAKQLVDKGADPNLAQATNGVTPLYAALNCQWSDKALYPQPRAFEQQKTSYLELMQALLEKGADPNARLTRKVWYSQYDFDQSGVDESGATPFFRAAYAADVEGMKILVKYGADPNLRTMRTPGRVRTGDVTREVQDVSPLPPVPPGGPSITPLLAASGAGYGEGFAANHHHHAPAGMLPAVKYLVEELHMDVNAKDHDGNTAIHNAAARGDNEMILYLVSKGADVLQVNREGKTTADMANGPVQRISPFPETIKLLEGMGAKNNHKCVSC